jgi:hypothetical protein
MRLGQAGLCHGSIFAQRWAEKKLSFQCTIYEAKSEENPLLQTFVGLEIMHPYIPYDEAVHLPHTCITKVTM